MSNELSIAMKITSRRRVRDWSRRHLADMAKVDRSTIGRIEQARRVHVATLQKVAHALGMEVVYELRDK